MRQKGVAADVGEAEVGVSEQAKVPGRNCCDDLLAKGFDNGQIAGVLGKVCEELAIRLGNLMSRWVGWKNGLFAGMDGRNEGYLGSGEVGGRRHDYGQVAIGSASMGGMDRFCVGVELLM